VLSVRTPRRDDRGLTLIELIAAMAIFAVLLVVFGKAIALMTTTTARVQGNTDSATQVRQATDVLSRQLGGAAATNSPVKVGSVWYLEFETDDVLAGTDPICTQWRYTQASGRLEYRTWSTVRLVGSAWFTAGRGLVNDPVTQPPFTVYPSDTGFSLPRMAVDLFVRTNRGNVLETEGQYTLRNATGAPPPTAATVCTQLGRP
jgi:prepilin-type N-terminal cleavage/methylation domain-containing protein